MAGSTDRRADVEILSKRLPRVLNNEQTADDSPTPRRSAEPLSGPRGDEATASEPRQVTPSVPGLPCAHGDWRLAQENIQLNDKPRDRVAQTQKREIHLEG